MKCKYWQYKGYREKQSPLEEKLIGYAFGHLVIQTFCGNLHKRLSHKRTSTKWDDSENEPFSKFFGSFYYFSLKLAIIHKFWAKTEIGYLIYFFFGILGLTNSTIFI